MSDILACLISRGVAPVRSVCHASVMATTFGIPIMVVEGLPLVDAKNKAVDTAARNRRDLLMIEDDIIASEKVWDRTLRSQIVTYAVCVMRTGKYNVIKIDGKVFTGNVFTRIPYHVLQAIPKPIFESLQMNGRGEVIPNDNDGNGSDHIFWSKIHDRGEKVECVGEVIHLRHPLNEERDNLSPCVVTEW